VYRVDICRILDQSKTMTMDAKLLCLGALMIRDASGYEIRKLYDDGQLGTVGALGFGSIYPALAALRKQGLVAVCADAPAGRADKKVYRLTDKGRETFLASLDATPNRDRIKSEMRFVLAFSDYLPPRRIIALIDQYIADYRARLAAADADEATTIVAGLDRAICESAIDFLTAERARRAGSLTENRRLAAATSHAMAGS
jgi:PadR family transcriptional regulator AphA